MHVFNPQNGGLANAQGSFLALVCVAARTPPVRVGGPVVGARWLAKLTEPWHSSMLRGVPPFQLHEIVAANRRDTCPDTDPSPRSISRVMA